jgi:Protein phosphatase 2C
MINLADSELAPCRLTANQSDREMARLFDARIFWLPKDLGFPQEYEDAFAVNAESGVAAVADGVASGSFSGKWARILTESAVAGMPDGLDADSLRTWLTPQRDAWGRQIDMSRLGFFQKERLKQTGGGYSTLLWVKLFLSPEEPESCNYLVRAAAVGDSCLFHVSGGQVLQSFPLKAAAEFEADPLTICSRNWNRDHLLEFQTFEGCCKPGDLLVLCTDALAKWAISCAEGGSGPCWEDYWSIGDEEWQQHIQALREAHAIRVDDTTLLLLRVGIDREQEMTEHGIAAEAADSLQVAAPAHEAPPQRDSAAQTPTADRSEAACQPDGTVDTAPLQLEDAEHTGDLYQRTGEADGENGCVPP